MQVSHSASMSAITPVATVRAEDSDTLNRATESVSPSSTDSPAAYADTVTLSPESRARSAEVSGSTPAESAEELADMLRSLEARDLEVRTHEQAHEAAGGELAGAASYSFRQGPDGRRYAVSGEVSIDISEVPGDPAATIDKMARVRRAALAPAQPSSQDRQVAAQAAQKMSEARGEMAAQQRDALQAQSDLATSEQELRAREIEDAQDAQRQAEGSDEESEEFISVADRFAEYNARLRQINETLLRISQPPVPGAGSILNDEA